MIIKNIFSLAASIISLFIFTLLLNVNSNSDENNIKYYSNDEGILSLMYHRFNEPKYPSTNIQIEIFKNQIEIIKNSDYNFHNPNNFNKRFSIPKVKKEILTTRNNKIDPTKITGEYVDPKEWDNIINNEQTTLIDVRNNYEVEI